MNVLNQARRGAAALVLLLTASLAAGQITELVDAAGAGPGMELANPRGVVVDAAGVVYVAGYASDNVLRIAPDGAVTEVLDAAGDGLGNALDGPQELALDGAGSLYVVGVHSSNVFRVASSGAVDEILDTAGVVCPGGVYVGGPRDVGVDDAGDVYVVTEAGAVYRLTPGGLVLDLLCPGAIGSATSMSVEGDGTLYVATLENAVLRVTPAGVVTQIIDVTGDGAGNPLHEARDPAVDAAGNVYVAGRSSNNVFRITPAGVITEIIDETAAGIDLDTPNPEYFEWPYELEVDADGNVVVGSWYTSSVFRIAPDGFITHLADNKMGTTTPSSLGAVWGIARDAAGNVYAAGEQTHNVIKITPQTASGTLRNAGANALSYTYEGLHLEAMPPVLGGTWQGVANLLDSGYTHAAIVGYSAPANVPLPNGQVILVGGTPLFTLPAKAYPATLWTLQVPSDPALAGVFVHTQAVHLVGPELFQLSNAQDLGLGL